MGRVVLFLYYLRYLQDHEAYGRVTKWITGTDMINHQNCFAANFGFQGKIPVPQLSFSLRSELNLGQYELEKYYSCLFVFVGGKYIHEINDVMKVAEIIAKQLNKLNPEAVFISGSSETLKKILNYPATTKLVSIHLKSYLSLTFTYK